MAKQETALIVGAGQGLSAGLARKFSAEGVTVAIAARNIDKLGGLCDETGAKAYRCDAIESGEVTSLFADVTRDLGAPDIVVYNASNRVRGPITEIEPEAVLTAIKISCWGAFLVAQQAAKLMVERGEGAIFFTGASAGVKGFANSSCFAMGKFGLRGLAQALARELHPQNIHIGHFVIDGGIRQGADDPRTGRGDDGLLEPDGIAQSYWDFWRQPRNSWAWEVELRPWTEKF
jgi:NAD(P)-dependent dehydrogenase (short-subunit alcohol dehydrogenase family)